MVKTSSDPQWSDCVVFILSLLFWLLISILEDAWEMYCHDEIIPGKTTQHHCHQPWRNVHK